MYEAVDSYTRYLPKRYEDAIRMVDVNGRDKLRDPGQGLGDHPQPDLRRRADAGRVDRVLPGEQPGGEEPPRAGEPDPLPGGVPPPRPPAKLMDEQGVARLRDVPHHRRPHRGAHEVRPRRHPRGVPRVQRVAARGLDVRLRRPDHPDARDHAARPRPRAGGARLVPRARRAHRPHPPRAGPPGRRIVDLDGRSRSSTRSGAAARKPASR